MEEICTRAAYEAVIANLAVLRQEVRTKMEACGEGEESCPVCARAVTDIKAITALMEGLEEYHP